MTHHLVILKKIYLDRIIRGSKTTECRLSRTRRPPFGHVAHGDTLWLKQSGGLVLAKAKVCRVEFFAPLEPSRLAKLKRQFADTLQAEPSFFDNYLNAKYATVIRLGPICRISPLRIAKANRCAWVVLPESPLGDDLLNTANKGRPT